MTKQEMLDLVKENLEITDETLDLIISDVIQDAMNYCNVKEIPIEMEIYIRKKVKSIIEFESKAESGDKEISSISEGDTSITYVSNKSSIESVYDLNKDDKKALQAFRRLRN